MIKLITKKDLEIMQEQCGETGKSGLFLKSYGDLYISYITDKNYSIIAKICVENPEFEDCFNRSKTKFKIFKNDTLADVEERLNKTLNILLAKHNLICDKNYNIRKI